MPLARVLACGHTAPIGDDCAVCGPSPAKRAESARKRSKASYVEVYATPRWRALRLKILRRDHFRCTTCGGKANQAGHHEPFTSGSDPRAWDEHNLSAQCGTCNGREASERYHATKGDEEPSLAAASAAKHKHASWVS